MEKGLSSRWKSMCKGPDVGKESHVWEEMKEDQGGVCIMGKKEHKVREVVKKVGAGRCKLLYTVERRWKARGG